MIDVSGDGRNNRGRPAAEARDEAVRAGVSINGLPILAIEPDLEEFYRDNVIGGPGAFVIPAASFETFADAILKKLVIEISDVGSAASPVAPSTLVAPGPVRDPQRRSSCRPSPRPSPREVRATPGSSLGNAATEWVLE